MWFFKASADELELEEAVRACGKAATRIEPVKLAPGETPPIDTTRFGGLPYAEVGDDWPMLHGHPCDFLAQINLNECYERPTEAYDLVTIFFNWYGLESDELLQAMKPGDNLPATCVARTYTNPSDEKAVELTRPIATSKKDYRIQACGAKLSRLVTYPTDLRPPEQFAEISQLMPRFRDFGKAYQRCVQRLGYSTRDYESFVGGYPTWVHDNTFYGSDCEFLGQIVYHPIVKNCMGDAAPLFIAFHRDEPTRFEFDPWQSH